VIADALIQSNVTTMVFSEPRLEELPDALFNVNLLMSR
jgi:hypothetical protein